ncbi:unnamed protein product [Acanthoscelides obtectus]|uniref:Uncharacterized protein n=1 Tax=Acanthoscelides obtectus TaxID=200917 RepID=A0A9P0P9U8_ACAOB|nr:unnamed protein product [Acanthoscelides obtectus]CAK1641788.1 hypothetical protein AOBTE_LOCUS12630 [Acanthoscelides obtectus]
MKFLLIKNIYFFKFWSFHLHCHPLHQFLLTHFNLKNSS